MNIEISRKDLFLATPTLKNGIHWFLLVVLSMAPFFPLSNFVGHPHWDYIRWIPFQDFSLSRHMLKDVLGNMLWFVMLGYLLHHQLSKERDSHRVIVTSILAAGMVSLSAEFFQVFCHNRISSMTDVVCNVLGAGLGGYFAQKQRAATATAPWFATCLSKVMLLKESTGSKTVQQITASLQTRPPAGFK